MKQKPFTKTQRRNVRENTYRVVQQNVCQTCKHCWIRTGILACHAVELRGKLEVLYVEANGCCDLWESRR